MWRAIAPSRTAAGFWQTCSIPPRISWAFPLRRRNRRSELNQLDPDSIRRLRGNYLHRRLHLDMKNELHHYHYYYYYYYYHHYHYLYQLLAAESVLITIFTIAFSRNKSNQGPEDQAPTVSIHISRPDGGKTDFKNIQNTWNCNLYSVSESVLNINVGNLILQTNNRTNKAQQANDGSLVY